MGLGPVAKVHAIADSFDHGHAECPLRAKRRTHLGLSMNHRDNEAGTAPPAPNPPHDADHAPAPVDLTEESVAGEEDPGASLDDGEQASHPPSQRG